MDEHLSSKILLKENGYLLRDNILSDELFHNLNEEVIKSWYIGDGWNTRVKGGDDVFIFTRQDVDRTKKIRRLINEKASYNDFNYLYHSLHESKDKNNLIHRVYEALIKSWSFELSEILPTWRETNFSLTSYTNSCFLDMHTDFSKNDNEYKVTLLLYFDSGFSNPKDSALYFKYKGKDTVIKALPNRGILFIPNSETIHGIPLQNDFDFDFCRLAFSGWLI